MSKSAIRTLELQALEAMRQASEPGTTEAARNSCFETAMSAMRSVAALHPKPRTKKRAAPPPRAPRRKQIVLFR